MTEHAMIYQILTYQIFLGSDVGKETIAVHDSATGQSHTLAKTVADLRRFLKSHSLETYAVCEATGAMQALC